MVLQVLKPTPSEDKLDKVLKVMNIVNTVYGIKSNSDKVELYKAQAKKENALADKYGAEADRLSGPAPKKEFAPPTPLNIAQAKTEDYLRFSKRVKMWKEEGLTDAEIKKRIAETQKIQQQAKTEKTRRGIIIPESQSKTKLEGRRGKKVGAETKILGKDYEWYDRKAQAAIDKLKKETYAKAKPSEAQKSIDSAFGKDYVDWNVTGAGGRAESTVVAIRDVINRLEKGDSLTGVSKKMMGQFGREILAPESQEMFEQARETAMAGLRAALGAQFTQKEGQMIIDNTYNLALSGKANAQKLRKLLGRIKAGIHSRQSAINYYHKNGSLIGYKGTTNFKSFFKPFVGKSSLSKGASLQENISNMSTEQLLKRRDELNRKKKGGKK